MTKQEADFMGSMNMCDKISNEAYKKIMCNCEVEESQPCEDAISREYVIALLENKKRTRKEITNRIYEAPSVTPKQTSWIPIKTRPLTEEEKEEIGHEYAFMYDCPLPVHGQEVLITDCYGNVEIDTFCRDHEGFYFENNCDDGEVIAWQPKPQSYNAESEDKNDD